jgi:hypothetical protein
VTKKIATISAGTKGRSAVAAIPSKPTALITPFWTETRIESRSAAAVIRHIDTFLLAEQ